MRLRDSFDHPASVIPRSYVDNRISWTAARVASEDSVELSGVTPLTVDGIELRDGDRVLLYGQTNTSENGIYTVVYDNDLATLVRAADASKAEQFFPGRTIYVTEGSSSKQTYTCANAIDQIDGYGIEFNADMSLLAAGDNVSFDWKDGKLEISARSADPFPDHLSKLPDLEHSLLTNILPTPEDVEPEAPGLPVWWELFSDLREDIVVDHLPDVKYLPTREELPGTTEPSDADCGVRWMLFSEDPDEPDLDLDDVRYHFDPGNLHGLGDPSDADCGVRWNLRSDIRSGVSLYLDDLVHSADGGVLSGGGLPSDKDNGLRFELFTGDRAVAAVSGLRDFAYLLDPELAGQTKIEPSDADTGWRFNLSSDLRLSVDVSRNVDILGNHQGLDVLPGSTRESNLNSGIRLELSSVYRDNAAVEDLDDIRYHFESGVLGGSARESDENSGINMLLFSSVRDLVSTGGLVDITTADETWFLSGFTNPSDLNSELNFVMFSDERGQTDVDLDDVEFSTGEPGVFPDYYGPSRLDSGLRFNIPTAEAREVEETGILEDVCFQ